MKKIILLVLFISLSKIFIAQENNFLNKTYENSIPNLEFGIGYLFNPSDSDHAISYQLASRNIFLNKKLGFFYTLEPTEDNTSDIFGINYRISNNFSLQAGLGILFNSFFDSKEDGSRKKISLAYHPDYMPLTFISGYSIDMGFTLGVNYRVFFNKNPIEKVK
jgi:hypothetical protein